MLIFLKDQQYVLAGLLVVILYCCCFLIGKKVSFLFLELSLLKFIRKNNGTREKSECSYFLRRQYRKKIGEDEFDKLINTIYSDLARRGILSIDNQSVNLTTPQP